MDAGELIKIVEEQGFIIGCKIDNFLVMENSELHYPVFIHLTDQDDQNELQKTEIRQSELVFFLKKTFEFFEWRQQEQFFSGGFHFRKNSLTGYGWKNKDKTPFRRSALRRKMMVEGAGEVLASLDHVAKLSQMDKYKILDDTLWVHNWTPYFEKIKRLRVEKFTSILSADSSTVSKNYLSILTISKGLPENMYFIGSVNTKF